MIKIFSLICLTVAFSFIASSQVKSEMVPVTSEAAKDSMLRERLIALAMQNPSIQNRDYRINAQEYEYRKSKSAWLEAISLQGNVNEFVVNNSPSASFFPKYNMGIVLPLNLFAKASNEKKSARELVKVAETEKVEESRRVRKEVLTRYENYKSAKDLFDFNKRLTIARRSTYTSMQKEFEQGIVEKLEDVNKAGQEVIDQEITERTSKRDYLISIIELEEIIGVDLDSVLNEINKKTAK